MTDRSYLDWPFLDTAHRELKTRLDDWCLRESEALAQDDLDDPRVLVPPLTPRASELGRADVGQLDRAPLGLGRGHRAG